MLCEINFCKIHVKWTCFQRDQQEIVWKQWRPTGGSWGTKAVFFVVSLLVFVCLFFLFPSFLHFPLLLSVCNKPTFSLRIVILLTVGWFVCRPWLVKDYRQWNHLRYVNIFFVRFSVLQEIVEPHFPLLPNESDCFLPVNLIQTLLCCCKTMQ